MIQIITEYLRKKEKSETNWVLDTGEEKSRELKDIAIEALQIEYRARKV